MENRSKLFGLYDFGDARRVGRNRDGGGEE
jgi:hypothetical protein